MSKPILVRDSRGVMRLRVFRASVEVSDDVKLGSGHSNPFGWSTYPLIHVERGGMAEIETEIGRLYCGEPEITADGYHADFVKTDEP